MYLIPAGAPPVNNRKWNLSGLGTFRRFPRRAGLDGLGAGTIARANPGYMGTRVSSAFAAGAPAGPPGGRRRARGRLRGFGQDEILPDAGPIDSTLPAMSPSEVANIPILPTSPVIFGTPQAAPIPGTLPAMSPSEVASLPSLSTATVGPGGSVGPAVLTSGSTTTVMTPSGAPGAPSLAQTIAALFGGSAQPARPGQSWGQQAPLGVSNGALLAVGGIVVLVAALSGGRRR